MSTTSPVSASSTGAAVTPATTAATTASQTASSDAFQAALKAGVNDARSIQTSSLGSMVEGALKHTRVYAVSLPTVVSASYANSVSSGSTAAASAGAKGKIQVPDELRAYGNGHVPADALDKIGIKSHRLWADASATFKEMRSAAAAAGVDIGVTDSYRDYDNQVDLVRRKGLYSQGGLAAKPGTSNHGWGLALDVDVTPAGLAWMRENAGQFGWVEAVPREPWHWEYHGAP